ncbi:hypothetical protein [Streptomyces sp. NPDC048720]
MITVRKRFVAGAVAWADRLRSEFDDAFPDEVPPRSPAVAEVLRSWKL